ncbi:response regulator [Horticoccus luteus]|uniref:Sensory/regulatory protein RpfC n=1 Tax=Horticoccus luteus TaxID=2862869 RepID=A0A8F9TSY9_9BACT|nr:ATP-binding protein [Horticoccus luteus]QYM77728.1 response regulator [Horticoccus luteus]
MSGATPARNWLFLGGLFLLTVGRAPAEEAVFATERWTRFAETHWAPCLVAGVVLAGMAGLLLGLHFNQGQERPVQTQELAEERARAIEARRAQEDADAANRAKSDFLATMSHEIRTPLNGIIGSAELMAETSLTAAQREYMATVQASAEALLSIINDILDFSKIEAGRVQLEHAMFDLRQPVIEVVKIVSSRTAGKDVEVILSIAPSVPACVYGDSTRLRQVLLNLCANAMKFTPRGQVVVQVEPEGDALADGKRRVRFAVADTGIGITADARPQLFQKFHQVDASTTRRFGGTGLGLAICKRLVELMGGEIGVESEVGRGSTFWFVLPFIVEDLPVAMAPLPWPRRLLIIDRLESRRQAVAAMARGLGIEVAVAESAAVALTASDGSPATRPQVILVDESDWAEATAEMARSANAPGWAESPWVVLARPGAKVAEGKVAATVFKPVLQPEQLLEALRVANGGMRLEPATTARGEDDKPRHRVLLAEDNAVNRMVASGMLRRLGCAVEIAENGAEAVVKARLNHYDVILLDCLMPEMDGWTAASEIRRSGEGNARTPIVATTANATAGDRERCLQAGMTEYLAKPLRLSELARVIEKYGRKDDADATTAGS